MTREHEQPRRLEDVFDLEADPEPTATAICRRIVSVLRAVDGPHWNGGRDVELEWYELDGGWLLRAGDRRLSLDRHGRVHEVSRGRLRVLDEQGVVYELAF